MCTIGGRLREILRYGPVFAVLLPVLAFAGTANITVMPSVTFQTWHYNMLQFQPTPGESGAAEPASHADWNSSLKPGLLGQLINQLGINTVQLTVSSGDIENTTLINGQDVRTYYNLTAPSNAGWGANRYAPVNDDGDPSHFNCPDIKLVNCTGSFALAGVDYAYDNYLIGPAGMKALVEANGETFHIDFQWIHWPSSATYLESNPAEVGEHILAAFTHIRNKYGAAFVPDIFDVMVEPDIHCDIVAVNCGNGGVWDETKLGNALAAIKSRLNAAGFTPRIWCCSTTSTTNALGWYTNVKAKALFTPDALTTHWYDANGTSHFPALISQAAADGIPLVMTELDGMGVDEMYTLMTAGNMSGVEKYDAARVSSTDSPANLLTITSTSPYASRYVGLPAPSPTYTWYFPQIWKYVREGDVREQAVSDNGSFLPLAFRSRSGLDKIPVLIHAQGPQTVNVTGAAAGTYGCTYTYSNAVLLQPCGPNQTIGAGGTLTAILSNIPPNPASSFTTAVVTFYGISPAILKSGVVPVYSTVPVIQPGSWVSIYGSNLASGTVVWNGRFPTSLGGTSVGVDGIPAYLEFVSQGQINFQAPDDTATGMVPVTVTTSGGTATSSVTLAPFAPSFLLQADGKHVTAIVVTPGLPGNSGAGYDIIGPSRPAKAGEVLEIYGVGFGPTRTAVPAGVLYQSNTPTTNLVEVTIGGVTLPQNNVQYSGLVEAGVYQLNVLVPANLGTGDQIISAVTGGAQTQSNVLLSLE